MKRAVQLFLLALAMSGCANLFYAPTDLELSPPQYVKPAFPKSKAFKVELLKSVPVSCISSQPVWDKKVTLFMSKKLLEQLVIAGDKTPTEQTNGLSNSRLAWGAKFILLHGNDSEPDHYGCFRRQLQWPGNPGEMKDVAMALFQSGQVAVAVEDFEGLVPYVTVFYYGGGGGGTSTIEILLPKAYVEKKQDIRRIFYDRW